MKNISLLLAQLNAWIFENDIDIKEGDKLRKKLVKLHDTAHAAKNKAAFLKSL